MADVCAPYLGPVTAVAGTSRLEPARALGSALAATIADVRSGAVDDVAVALATVRLDISPLLARRYVDRLRDDREGLLPDAAVDPAALETVAALRRRFLPDVVDGVDVLARPSDAVL